jgi:large subunit ribosomal protein L15
MENKVGKTIIGRRKRVGRGYGSGKGGHTVGRGQKGQKTRAGIGILFEGFKVKKSFIKRLPMKRGKSRNEAKAKPLTVSIEKLNSLPAGSKVTLDLLITEGIVDAGEARKYGVKILGGGTLTKKMTIDLPMSKSAMEKVSNA